MRGLTIAVTQHPFNYLYKCVGMGMGVEMGVGMACIGMYSHVQVCTGLYRSV